MNKAAIVVAILWASLFNVANNLCAQPIPVEVMAGTENYLYQHYFSKPIGNKQKFGFFHTASLYFYYQERNNTESMTQSYLTYQLNSYMKIAMGTFYATGPGFKPALALQFFKKTKNSLLLVVPRTDIWKNPSLELMVLAEYTPPLSDRWNGYARVQLMSNYGPDYHNRSYQNFRVGIGNSTTQAGIALNIDEFGRESSTRHNAGLFLRKEFH